MSNENKQLNKLSDEDIKEILFDLEYKENLYETNTSFGIALARAIEDKLMEQ